MSRCDMNRYKISVIVPIYNVEKWLRECLNSLVNQTVPFYEIILVNDGSTDSSPKICNEYKIVYNNIKVFSQINQGQSTARNTALKYCSGDFVWFIDGDDYISSYANERLINILKKYTDLDVIYFDRRAKYDIKCNYKTPSRNKILEEGDVLLGIDFYKGEFLGGNLTISPCLSICKFSLIKENNIKFSDGLYYEDNLFCLQIAFWANKVTQINDTLYIRRWRENSTMTSPITLKKVYDLLKINQLIIDFIYENKMFYDDVKFLKSFIKSRYLLLFSWTKQYKKYDIVNDVTKIFDISVAKLLSNNDDLRSEFIRNIIVEENNINILTEKKQNNNLKENIFKLQKKLKNESKKVNILKKTIKIISNEI